MLWLKAIDNQPYNCVANYTRVMQECGGIYGIRCYAALEIWKIFVSPIVYLFLTKPNNCRGRFVV